MGVIYDFNQQIIPTDNDYDVVKVVPMGFVLYRENMPSFAFFPGQFVGVRNGIKVNDPQSNWKLLEIDSYFAQFGNQKEVIENLPEEFKEVLRKFLLQAAKTSIDTQKNDYISEDEAVDALEEIKEKPNIYKILDKFSSERIPFSSSEDLYQIIKQTNDPKKLVFILLPLVVSGLDAVSSPDLYSYREEVDKMTLEEFVKMLKTTGLSSVKKLIEDIAAEKGWRALVPYELQQAEQFIESINGFPILEFLKEQLSEEEYKAIVSLKVKDFTSAFLHGVSDEEKDLFRTLLSRKYLELASSFVSFGYISIDKLNRFIDLVINNVYLNLADTGSIGKKFVEDEDNGINLLFALADTVKFVFKEISYTKNFLEHLKEYALLDPEVIELEKQVKRGTVSKEMLLIELLSFIKELEKIKKIQSDTDQLVKLSPKLGIFFAKVVILTEGQSSKFSQLVDEAKNYISNTNVEDEEFKKLEYLIKDNFLKIIFNKDLKKFFEGFSEQKQKTNKDRGEFSTADSDLYLLSLKDLEKMFIEARARHLSKLPDLVDLENLDTNLDRFILQPNLSSAIQTNVTIRNTEIPAYLALFVSSIDPRLFNSISGKDSLKKHQYFKEFLEKLNEVKAQNLSNEEETLYIRSLSLVAKDFTEISEDEINSFINLVNAYIQDEKTLNNAINIINNVFKAASFIFGRREQYFNKPQLGILALHDKIIESLEIEKVLKLSDPSLTENYIFNFRQQLRLLNQRGVNHIRRDPGSMNVLKNYMASVQEVAESLQSISPDVYEDFVKIFIGEFSLYGDHAFLNGIEKINQSLMSIFKKLKHDIFSGKFSSDLDALQKIFKAISLGEILRAGTIIPFKEGKIPEPISSYLLEKESSGTFFTIAKVQYNLNSLLKEVQDIFEYIKIIHPNNKDILQQLFTFPEVIKKNLGPLIELKLNVSLPGSNTSDTFFGEVYFCDNNVVRDPKILPKIFTHHGTQSLYYSILNPGNSKMSRHDVFSSLSDQWKNLEYVPPLQTRYEKEIYGNTGVRRSKINLSSADSTFEQDNILTQANIQNISVSTTLGNDSFYSKELKTIDIKYELGEEEIYFKIPVGVPTAYSGFMEYLFSSAYLSNDVSEYTLAKMYLVLDTLKIVRKEKNHEKLQTLLAGDKLVDLTIEILQELQASPSGKKILDKALYRYMSLAGGFSYGKKGRQEQVLVDVSDAGETNEVLTFLFSKPIQDLGRKTSKAFLDILDKVPDVFRSVLSLPSVIRILYVPANFQYSTVLGFTTDKPSLFSRRYIFSHRLSHEDNRTAPITLVVGGWGTRDLFSAILRTSNDTFFDYDLFSSGGKSEIQTTSGYEEKEVFFKDSTFIKSPYSSYHGNSSPITTAMHEIGHTIYYELPFQTKKRMFEFYLKKYIKEVEPILDKFLDNLSDSTKKLVKVSLSDARLVALQLLESNITEKRFKELLKELHDSLKYTANAVYGHLSNSSNLEDDFKRFVKEIKEKYMAPYTLTSFYELSSVAFDAYMYNREEFVRNFPEEYKSVIIPMLEYIYNNKGVDLTVEGLWGEKVQDADFFRMLA